MSYDMTWGNDQNPGGANCDPTSEPWAYVTLKRIREGYTWSIGATPATSEDDLRRAMHTALAIDDELRQRLGMSDR